MPAALRRHPARSALLALTAAALALPAPAAAKDPLAGARLTSAIGSVQVKTFRCPPGEGRSSTKCGQTSLEMTFASGKAPKVRRLAAGRQRITGSGRSVCTSHSPVPDAVTLPDGSMQLLGPASRVTPGHFDQTDLVLTTTHRTARWTWLEPTAPSAPCRYFFGEGTTEYPEPAISERFGLATLKKRRFSVTLTADAEQYEQRAADGSRIFGDATWKLVLRYTRR